MLSRDCLVLWITQLSPGGMHDLLRRGNISTPLEVLAMHKIFFFLLRASRRLQSRRGESGITWAMIDIQLRVGHTLDVVQASRAQFVRYICTLQFGEEVFTYSSRIWRKRKEVERSKEKKKLFYRTSRFRSGARVRVIRDLISCFQ